VAADKFRKNEIKEIIVARAYVQTGKTSGFKPGTSLQKLYPYVRNVLDTIKQRIGHGAYEIALKDGESGEIQVQEVESIRGRSFDEKSFLIIDEGQQTTPEEMQSIVTRVSDNCKLVLCGDVLQKDIKGESGLEWFMSFAKRHNLKGVAVIDFDSPNDIVRGGLVKDIAIGLAKDRKESK
jgi:phosphate starvation-inducible PhoH-like protein